ncbi:hypothetical protein NDU88_002351 [Pleurodeles waltl]|uniref:Mannosyltransferase n=1 Tax=Pleurodeles waltl TaxID=8319 RepID=A0AAV7WS32_PLEWA|nr:hypothetical protein NDU88_002351 [Pleurodeles waltl]
MQGATGIKAEVGQGTTAELSVATALVPRGVDGPVAGCWLGLPAAWGAEVRLWGPERSGFPCGTGGCSSESRGDAGPGARLVAVPRERPGSRRSHGCLKLFGPFLLPTLGSLRRWGSASPCLVGGSRSPDGGRIGPRILWTLRLACWQPGVEGRAVLLLRSVHLGLPGEEGAWSCPAAAFGPGHWRTSWGGRCVLALLLAWFLVGAASGHEDWPRGSGHEGEPRDSWPLVLMSAGGLRDTAWFYRTLRLLLGNWALFGTPNWLYLALASVSARLLTWLGGG